MTKREQYVVYDANKHIMFRLTLQIELRSASNGKPELSICGDIKQRNSWLGGGQCLDRAVELAPHLLNNKRFAFWYKMWRQYHLNSMHAGTHKQEEALQEAYNQGILDNLNADNYSTCCQYLQSVGLYEVKYHNKPYRYGEKWLYWAIPKKDLESIRVKMQDNYIETKVYM